MKRGKTGVKYTSGRFLAVLLLVQLFAAVSCTDRFRMEAAEESYDVLTRSPFPSGEIYSYFTYLAIGSEYIDYDRVCRWETEIKYSVDGGYTEDDLAVIERLCADLNRIDGFPGISPAGEEDTVFLTISFIPQDEIRENFAYGPASDSVRIEGITEYTASGDTCHIISARIAVDCDLEDPMRRSSAVCEEIVQSLGLGNDSMQYADSIFYEGTSEADYPSELDFDMVRLLYCGYVEAGMTAEELCEAAGKAMGLVPDTDKIRTEKEASDGNNGR